MRTQDKLDCMMALMSEIDRSIAKHGDWQGYDQADVCKAVCGEHQEYLGAYIAQDVASPHGQAQELLQVAATAIKGFFILGGLNVSHNHLSDLQPVKTTVGITPAQSPERCCYCLQPMLGRDASGDAVQVVGLGG